MDHYPTIKLAAVQASPVWLDREKTVEKACRYIYEAGEKGADIIGFPESFIPGYPAWYYYHPATSLKSFEFARELFKNAVEIPGKTIDKLCSAAREANIYVVMGINERRAGTTGTLFNTNIFIDKNGQLIGKRQKLVPTTIEKMIYMNGCGSTLRTYPSDYGQISSLMCGENANPFAVSLMASEYPVVHIANWPPNFIPRYVDMPDTILMLSRYISYSCKCFVISACGVNTEEMVEILPLLEEDKDILRDQNATGGSTIIAPGGIVLAGPWVGNEEGILYADADLENTVQGRLIQDVGGHYNRADVIKLIINESKQSLVTRVGSARHFEQALADAGMEDSQRCVNMPGEVSPYGQDQDSRERGRVKE